MNQFIGIGRLTKDPDIRYTQNNMCVARYTLAIDRPKQQNGQSQADFISCICFDKRAEFASRYLHKGMKIAIEGRIQTGFYDKQDGTRVYTTDVVVNNHEFCEARQDNAQGYQQNLPAGNDIGDGFMAIPQGVDDEGLPWN